MNSLKQIIKDFCIGKKYFCINSLEYSLENYLIHNNISFKNGTIKKYLSEFRKENIIFDAGRGWYSTIAEESQLDDEPVKEIIKIIKTQYPFLPFYCWSTAQLKTYFHHTQTKFLTFVHTENDYLPTLFEFLREKYNNVYLNPDKKEINKNFIIKDNTIILRRSIQQQSTNEYLLNIERILVDLYVEGAKFYLLDKTEYKRVFYNLVEYERISIATLLSYARSRGNKIEKVIKQLIINI